MNELDILKDTIYKYIEIINENEDFSKNLTTLLITIKNWSKEYSEYNLELSDIYKKLKKEYKINTLSELNNPANKYILLHNHNLDFVESNYYKYDDKFNNRFMYYLTLITLIGKPQTSREHFLIAELYSWNSNIFSKEVIYYWNKYLNGDLYENIIYPKNNFDERDLKEIHLDSIYNYLAKAYTREKDYESAISYYKKIKGLDVKSEIINLYIRGQKYSEALDYIKEFKIDLTDPKISHEYERLLKKINK